MPQPQPSAPKSTSKNSSDTHDVNQDLILTENKKRITPLNPLSTTTILPPQQPEPMTSLPHTKPPSLPFKSAGKPNTDDSSHALNVNIVKTTKQSEDTADKERENNFKIGNSSSSNNNTLSSTDLSTELSQSQIENLVNSTNTDTDSEKNETINSEQMLSLAGHSDNESSNEDDHEDGQLY